MNMLIRRLMCWLFGHQRSHIRITIEGRPAEYCPRCKRGRG
jgi:hypothetical protein